MRRIFTLVFILSAGLSNAQTHIVISQVYGGGGNAGATYKNDFIELYNPTAAAVDITGWSVQYTSATGNFGTLSTTLSGTMQPGKYYLIQEAIGAGGTTNLPTPDATGTIAMSATAGKVALVNNSALLAAVSCPIPAASIIDFVGYGTTANCFEGATFAPAPTNTTADIRNAANLDTDNNGVDFTTTAPNPRNSASVLPIILQDFSANKNGKNIDLHWQVNCLSISVTFELQRSSDAINFQTFYTSTETKARCAAPFDYTDANTLSGKNYYRLKIVDIDGKTSYSKIALIVNGTTDKGLLSVHPTIVTTQAEVYYTSANAEKVQWIITDMQGRIAKQITTSVVAGDNKIAILTSELSKGQYQLKGFTAEGPTAVVRFVKL